VKRKLEEILDDRETKKLIKNKEHDEKLRERREGKWLMSIYR
jgi:hypothetical protein